MDPLSALSLACNVMQVISFCHETISLCKRLHREGSSYPDLDDFAAHLSSLSSTLHDSIDTKKSNGRLDEQEKELQLVAKESYVASISLQAELAKVSNVAGGSHRAAFKATMKTIWRKNTLDRLEQTMLANQKLLESKLLQQI